MRQSDCVVLPYLEATQSGVLAAAFANGRFVIASEVGGIPDVAEHGVSGLLVPACDAKALAEAITKAADTRSLRHELAQGARHTAQTRLNWDRIGEIVLQAYRSLSM